jgi:predicted ribosomally synthesized peptide with nif11-like leader
MSKREVERFFTEVSKNEELMSDLLNRLEVSVIVQVGNTHGYNITEEDVRAYSEEQKAALTAKELENVAGGSDVRDSHERYYN